MSLIITALYLQMLDFASANKLPQLIDMQDVTLLLKIENRSNLSFLTLLNFNTLRFLFQVIRVYLGIVV